MNKRSLVLYCIIALIILTIYGPFVLKGGFGPSDDLALLKDQGRGFYDLATESITRLGHASRPIYGLIQVITIVIFGDNPIPYNVLKLVLWLSTVLGLSVTVRTAIGQRAAWIFVLLASLPIFTSSHIFASFQMGYLLSVLFWSLSLILLRRHIIGRGTFNYYMSYFCLLLGLLSCEIILPLLVVTALLPMVYVVQEQWSGSIWGLFIRARRFVSPLILLSLGFLIFKVYLTKSYQLGEGSYGLSPISAKSLLQSGYYFFALLVEVPIMMIMVVPHLLQLGIILTSILIVLFFICLRKMKDVSVLAESGKHHGNKERYFLWIILISLISCFSIFILSGYPAVTFGNYNKMMLPSYLLVSILLASVMSKLIRTNWFVAVTGVSILWASSMIVQLNNFCDSWEIREKVLYDCAKKMNETNMGSEPYVLACVPFFTENNYNNEHAFWLSWDFSAGLKLYGLEKTLSAFPFCWQTLINPDYYSRHNINHHLDQLPEDANLWYYEFDLEKSQSSVRKMEDRTDLIEEFQRITNNKVNRHSIILREKIRMKLKDWTTQWILNA